MAMQCKNLKSTENTPKKAKRRRRNTKLLKDAKTEI